jgi:hypothetical protein
MAITTVFIILEIIVLVVALPLGLLQATFPYKEWSSFPIVPQTLVMTFFEIYNAINLMASTKITSFSRLTSTFYVTGKAPAISLPLRSHRLRRFRCAVPPAETAHNFLLPAYFLTLTWLLRSYGERRTPLVRCNTLAQWLLPTRPRALVIGGIVGSLLALAGLIAESKSTPEINQAAQSQLGVNAVMFSPPNSLTPLFIFPIVISALWTVAVGLMVGIFFNRWRLAFGSIICFIGNVAPPPLAVYTISAYTEVRGPRSCREFPWLTCGPGGC